MPADETISVVYEPIPAPTNGFVPAFNLPAFHETLVYTEADGTQEYATAYPEIRTPPGNPLDQLFQAKRLR
jgi:hypothetical protein